MRGEVTDDEDARREASRQSSLFERMPELVVYPEDADDVSAIVRLYVPAARARIVRSRAGGTDMSGGPLTTRLSSPSTKHMNHMGEVL